VRVCGCAGEPMTYEQWVALASVGAGLRGFGDGMRESSRYQGPVHVYPEYNPAYSPVFAPVPITGPGSYGYGALPVQLIPSNGY
jgi:hypothetical protein